MDKEELRFIIRMVLTQVIFPIIFLSAIVFLTFMYAKNK
jgi:hypothetical protein